MDDHTLLREGLCALLRLESDLSVLGAAGDAAAALKAVRDLKPRLVIADIALPGLSGVELIGQLVALAPALRILVLTAHHSKEYIRAALEAGAHGYVLKDAVRTELLRAIRTVGGGGRYFCAATAAKVIAAFVKGGDGSNELITSRERQVLTLVAQGRANKAAARELGLSVKTVEKHRASLMRKFNLHNAAAVTLFAFRHGFLEVGAASPAPAADTHGPATARAPTEPASQAPRKSE